MNATTVEIINKYHLSGRSASSYERGGGGGSGYVLTKSSVKVGGYLLGEEYYLSDAYTLMGNQSFPNTGKSGNETGHLGNGYAIIRQIEIRPFPPRPNISSILDFSFSRSDDHIVKDECAKFTFNESGTYSSIVSPGNFIFNANGSSCGQSILGEYRIKNRQNMSINISNNIIISVDDETILIAPGYRSSLNTTISPKFRIFNNYSMYEYICTSIDLAQLSISYYSFIRYSCRYKIHFQFQIFSFLFLLTH